MDSFMPHGYCMMWEPGLIWLHVLADAGIVLAYFAIPVGLFSIVRKNETVPFPGLLTLFAAFILACGLTHLIEIAAIWKPVYWLEGALKAATAIVSLTTAAVFLPLLPKAFTLRGPEALEKSNAALVAEIARREEAETELRKRQEQIVHLAGRLLSAQEEERRKIARDLHDDAVQDLAMLQIDLGSLILAQEAHAAVKGELEGISAQVSKLHEKLRLTSHTMHPTVIDLSGLKSGLKDLCADIPSCETAIDSSVDSLPAGIQLAIYRIVQEALGNAIKHAGAANIRVSAKCDKEQVRVTIADDGDGFDPAVRSSGLGLRSMRERIHARDGSLVIDSAPGKGTRIQASFPVEPPRS